MDGKVWNPRRKARRKVFGWNKQRRKFLGGMDDEKIFFSSGINNGMSNEVPERLGEVVLQLLSD